MRYKEKIRREEDNEESTIKNVGKKQRKENGRKHMERKKWNFIIEMGGA